MRKNTKAKRNVNPQSNIMGHEQPTRMGTGLVSLLCESVLKVYVVTDFIDPIGLFHVW